MLLPNSVMVGYGRHSETAPVLVHNDGLANLNELKIQSFPFGNLGGAKFKQLISLKIF